MSALAVQQQALVAALFDWPATSAIEKVANYAGKDCVRGLQAYQANGHALACRALRAAYPVLTQMLGEDSMDDLARAVWHAHPPLHGDVAQWGGAVADFVADSEQLRSEPYLADVARLEWALHQSLGVADGAADLATLALLSTEDPSVLGLRLAPATQVLRSVWPVASVWRAHVEGEPSLEEAGARLRARAAEDVIVWREGLQARAREALPGEADVLAVLLQGGSLGQALDNAPTLDTAAWLPLAVQSGLLLAVHLL